MNKLEILLFYITDKNSQIENVLSGFKKNREVAPELMLQLCVKFFAKHHPNADIYLITNNETNIHLGIPRLQLIRTDAISHEKILFDLTIFRKAYLESKLNKNIDIIFTDIDVLINQNLAHVFLNTFDVATTIDTQSNPLLNHFGLPINSLMFNFTGGIYFVRSNQKALDFYDAIIDSWIWNSNNYDFLEYGKHASNVERDFYKWWGELHSVSYFLGKDVLTGKVSRKVVKNIDMLFLPEIEYNYAPNFSVENEVILLDSVETLSQKKMIHFRGIRKAFMEKVASELDVLVIPPQVN